MGGPAGHLCALEQAKAWALREVWAEEGKSNYGMLAFVAKRVVKNDGSRPTTQALAQLFERIDSDDEWFPGKQNGEKRGRKRVLSGAKASAVCRAAKAIKSAGSEVTYPLVCANATQAVRNPGTGQPVSKHAVYDCLRTGCYDKVPEKKWANRRRLGRTALTSKMIERRLAWAVFMQTLALTSDWCYQNLVWVDI